MENVTVNNANVDEVQFDESLFAKCIEENAFNDDVEEGKGNVD